MSQWHGGKGSTPRKVDKKKFDENWDRIFGKKDTDRKLFAIDVGDIDSKKALEIVQDVFDAYNEERLVSKYDKASKITVDKEEDNK